MWVVGAGRSERRVVLSVCSEGKGVRPLHSIVGALNMSVRICDLYPERPMRPDARDAK